MSTVSHSGNPAVSSNPATSSNNHQPVKSLVYETRFKDIENKATNGKNDKVNLSAKSLFLFKLNVHAANIEDDAKRNQFVDALESLGDKMFTKDYLERLRNPFFSGENISAPDKPFPKLNITGGVAKSPNDFGVIVGDIWIPNKELDSLSHYSIPLKGDVKPLEASLKVLSKSAAKVLSEQDVYTLQTSMKRAIGASNNMPHQAFDLFYTNYYFDKADYTINHLPLNQELKQGFNNLLAEIRSAYTQSIHNYMQVQNQQIKDYPQHAAGIRDTQLAIKEGLSIHNKLQDYLKNSNSGFLESESYFQSLIGGARYIELMDADQISRVYEHYQMNRNEFKRELINKKWNIQPPPPEKSTHDIAFEIADKETLVLSKQYIDAINAYIKTAKRS